MNKKAFDTAVVEIKLNPNKVNDLISQLKTDADYFKKLNKYKNIIYLGFINCKNVDSKTDFIKLAKIQSIVYGIKNSKFYGRNVTRFNDWLLISEVKELKGRMSSIEGKVEELK